MNIEFLTAVYPYYEIVIWSQTSWRWLELKLTELGILTNTKYKILFVIDKSPMFKIISKQSNGQMKKHYVKALQLIWQLLHPIYSSNNTIHIDDLQRNFALNPQSGLKIKAYNNSIEQRYTDKELLYLQYYLILIATYVHDFNVLDHKLWKEYITNYQHLLTPEQRQVMDTSR